MDFQVYKNKVLQKLGQASVEYILLVVVISTAVLGLLSFSDTIKGKIESQKADLAIKIGGGGAEITRSDFSFKNVVVKDIEGGGADGAAGSGKKGGAGKGNKGKGGAGGQGDGTGSDGKGGLGKGQGDGGEGEGGDGENDDEEDLKKRKKSSNQETADSESYSQEQKRRTGKGTGYRQGESGYTDEEDDGGIDLLNTKSPEELQAIKEKEEVAKKWNIFKFLIIIAIIFFFIVIVLKARNARD